MLDNKVTKKTLLYSKSSFIVKALSYFIFKNVSENMFFEWMDLFSSYLIINLIK